MKSIISEKDISSTVQDFETFCSFITENKLKLTASGTLGKIACFDLNSRMNYPVPNIKNTSFMEKYPSIVLYHTIALETGLLEPSGSKSVLTATEYYTTFEKMSIYSKYLFIFLAWIKYIDSDAIYGHYMNLRWFSYSLIENTFDQIGKAGKPVTIMRPNWHDAISNSEDEPLQYLMNACMLLLHHYRDLGLIEYDDKDVENPRPYRTAVKKLRLTELGILLSPACTARRFTWINVFQEVCLFGDEVALYENDFKPNPPGTLGFLKPFAACFPENEIDAETVNKLLFPQPAVVTDTLIYEFRVNLGRDCYRVIQCGSDHSFEDLHLAIQGAFDFDNDHLYAFSLDGKRRSSRRINSPYCDEPPFADEVPIGAAGLREQQKILYIFDFGDNWMFNITLLAVYKSDIALVRPNIAKSVGKAPEQYPSDDDEGWDED